MAWNTQSDGSAASYDDAASVTNLTDAGATAVLFAQWGSKAPYAYLDSNNKLTLSYDYGKSDHLGTCLGALPMSAPDETLWPWNDKRSSITSVVIDDSMENCTSITSYACMFRDLTNCTSISGFGNLDSSNVVLMNHMFTNCTTLQTIDSTTLGTFDVSTLDMAKVYSCAYMFENCDGLKNLIGMGTQGSPTSFGAYVNGGCSCEGLCIDCNNLQTADFYYCNVDSVNSFMYAFAKCQKMETIDLSCGIPGSAVASCNLNGMFYAPGESEVKALKTIYCQPKADWGAHAMDESVNMFAYNDNLVGGEGYRKQPGFDSAAQAHDDLEALPDMKDGLLTSVAFTERYAKELAAQHKDDLASGTYFISPKADTAKHIEIPGLDPNAQPGIGLKAYLHSDQKWVLLKYGDTDFWVISNNKAKEIFGKDFVMD